MGLISNVFEALLAYIHVLIILFGSWNIVAAKYSGTSGRQHCSLGWGDAHAFLTVLSVSVFLVTSSVFIFVLVPMYVVVFGISDAC